MSEQIKSKKRVSDQGEVFTNSNEVNAILDMVKDETERIDSKFLEPSCGNGNFIIEILNRKLDSVQKQYDDDVRKYDKLLFIAVCSIYGIEFMYDNVIECRNKMLDIVKDRYAKACGKSIGNDLLESIKCIVETNIVHGNTLSMRRIDDNGNETNDPIMFVNWFVDKDDGVSAYVFRFDEMVDADDKQLPVGYIHLESIYNLV